MLIFNFTMTKYITAKLRDFEAIDKRTGELLELQQVKKLKIEEFLMIFIACCPGLLNLKGIPLKVLICCWKHSSYNKENCVEGNIVNNSPSFKKYCREDGLNTSDACIDRAFSQLCSANLLIRKCRGEYLLNPKYFFKGTLSDRTKLIMHLECNDEN